VRIAYLVTHPIQYQAPLLRRIAQEATVDLTVFFCSNFSVSTFTDPEFGRSIAWDVPLLEGYKHEFLPTWTRADRVSFWRPWNYGLVKRLRKGEFDVLWVHGYRRYLHLAAMLAARLMGMRVMLRDEATLISSRYGPLKRAAKWMLFRVLTRLCTDFLAIGTLNREYYLRFGVDKDRIFMMPYAVDNRFFRMASLAAAADREALRSSLGLKKGRPIILYASKLIARKRPADLLEAYIRLSDNTQTPPTPYLIFVGDGEARPELERRVAELGWDSVKFLGFKNQTELPSYYDLCDVFVLPSEREPWGLVINEVMSAGCAAIVSDRVGCSADLVRNGYNGYVVEVGNVEALSEALRLMFEVPGRCHVMGRRSLEIIQEWGFEQDVAGLKEALSICNTRTEPC
jgi:glycosyltransferase involved in cell wall biosynthesis